MTKPEPVIFFETERWAVRKHAPIEPAGKFKPDVWKRMPAYVNKQKHKADSDQTVKGCPGIKDFMETGFVIPAWCDMEITPSECGNFVNTRYSDSSYNDAHHPPDQVSVPGAEILTKFGVRASVKLDCPWKIWSKPNWSVLYQPMFYHEDRNYEAIPGIIDHDLGALISPVNIMLKEIKPTFIKMGEPLVQLIPIKRETVVARSGDLSETSVNRHNAIIGLQNIIFNTWSKWQHAKKTYIVDKNDTDLPGDN
jgi:hypothetical protein|tara:strand:+ start:2083 stop:2838 length:756 start_codon:yes stop_codon:yes gene_type:complete